jgi:digeranylgeranylglycerophospholipid reductase
MSVLGRRSGIHPGFEEYGLGVEYDLSAPHFNQDEALLLFGDHVAPGGYAWAFPYGGQRVRVGVGVPRPPNHADPLEYLERLAMNIPALARGLAGSKIVELHRGLIPFLAPLKAPLAADGLVVVGDAAGQNSALAGEGIRYAIEAGQLAGDAIITALAAGDCSLRRLKRYETSWRKVHGRDLWIAFRIHRAMLHFTDADWSPALALLQRLSPAQFAGLLRNEFTAAWILDLTLHNMPLFPPALGFMLKPRGIRLGPA